MKNTGTTNQIVIRPTTKELKDMNGEQFDRYIKYKVAYEARAKAPKRLNPKTFSQSNIAREVTTLDKGIKHANLKTAICAMLLVLPFLTIANLAVTQLSAKGYEEIRSNEIEANISPVRFTDEELIAFCASHGQEWRGGLTCKSIPTDVEQHPVRLLLWNKAKEYNTDFRLMDAIVKCESGYDPKADNPKSTADGLAQFTDGTWRGYARQRGLNWTLADKYDAEKNADMLAYVLSVGGLHNWEADPNSESCWSKLVASN